jgi:pimeloyl-ACP methyl ester carboxylesterase
MDILLVAGLWLDASAWDSVLPELRQRGHRPVAVSLPGQGEPPPDETLGDQRDAVVAAVDAAVRPVMVVGHSAASTLAWMAADVRPDKVAKVTMIGGFPSKDGGTYADSFEVVDGGVPFPGWGAFEGPDSADLDAEARRAFESRAVAVPEAVTTGVVGYTDHQRFAVPVTLVCPEFSPAQAIEWVRSGQLLEIAGAKHVDYVDIDSGHWPMLTRPVELARVLAEIADA